MADRNRLLINALTANALFSGTAAAALLLAPGWFAAQLGLESSREPFLTGLLLALFAGQLAWIVIGGRIRRWEIRAIIGADLVWVAGSLVLGLLYYDQFTGMGVLLVSGAAVAVLGFAELQGLGLRRAAGRFASPGGTT